jgi:O-antigen ligase
LLPLGAGGCVWAWRRQLPALALAGGLAVVVAAAAAFLAVSRGAWLGLAAAAVVAGWYGRRVRALPSPRDARLGRAVIIAALAVLSLPALLAIIHVPIADRLLGGVSLGDSVVSRTAVWRDARVLIGDYPFTGSGLGSTPMVYSTYVLLIHDAYLAHAHSLLLQITIEQGIAGGALFAAMVGGACWAVVVERRTARRARTGSAALRVAALASLTALVVHGAVDGGLYASKAALLLFAPLGMAYGLARESAARPEGDARRGTALLFLLAALAAGLLLLPAVRAAAQANIGALDQTRSELAAYHWPQVPLQDVLRRPGGVDLSAAEARFRAALALDPENVTANRRLGQIALANEERVAARRYLNAAYAAGPAERPTRQMLGELAALDGDAAQAASLWRGIEFAGAGLQVRKWWYGSYLGQPQAAEALARAEVTLDDRD